MTIQGEEGDDHGKRGRGGLYQTAHDGNMNQAGGMKSAIAPVDW